MVNPDLSSAVTFWAASSPPALRAALVVSHLGEGQPRAGTGGRGHVQAEKGMSQWKPGRLQTCGNHVEKPGQAAWKSRSCLPLPPFASPGAGRRGGLGPSGSPGERRAALSPGHRVSALAAPGRCGSCAWLPRVRSMQRNTAEGPCPKEHPSGVWVPGARSWGV